MSIRDAHPRRVLVAWITAMALIAVTVATPVSAAPTTTAIRDWNIHALRAIFNMPTAGIPGAGQPPPVGQIHLAMVQGAVYDAVNSIDGGHEPYRDVAAAPSGASIDAAVATAAYDVLVGLEANGTRILAQVVVDWLTVARNATLDGIPDGPAKEQGKAAGAAAAFAMLQDQGTDGRYGPFRFTPGFDAGEWRPTPTVNDPNAWVAEVDPFVLKSGDQFRTHGPRKLQSGAYAHEYDEVKEKGSATGSTRTQAETDLANFYFVNPIELWNRTFRTIALANGLDAAEEARLFAMLNLAGADSLINCWAEKARWSFWRPETAILEGDDDGNRKTQGATDWTPFIRMTPAPGTPPYPDHTSGYNCVTGAVMHSAKAFFGSDKLSFDVFNTATAVTPRHYDRFTDVVEDTIDARIFQGVHFRSADVQGAWIGKKVAQWLAGHYLQPVP